MYFLKHKSDVLSNFKKFKFLVEKQSGYELKGLRIDRGGEFTSNAFEKCCEVSGIWRQLTASYTPQQNEVAERKNKSLVEMAKCMLKVKNLLNYLWAEAVNTTTYILNRSPTMALHNQTPFEAWNGWKPKVSHLKVLGCISSVHTPSQKRSKLDDNSVKYIFVGYTVNTKGYRFL